MVPERPGEWCMYLGRVYSFSLGTACKGSTLPFLETELGAHQRRGAVARRRRDMAAVRCIHCRARRDRIINQRRGAIARRRRDMAGAVRSIVALGVNVGDRAGTIGRALHALKRYGTVEATASLVESAAAYVTDQPAFLNTVCALRTSLPPLELLGALKTVERELGRVERQRWAGDVLIPGCASAGRPERGEGGG